ncbi:hypothetical protein CBS101457_004634 [Exobasidium rhododendri]|nr:hypothetical protein CBS101457_004634 [Exobasidium rhododendri]
MTTLSILGIQRVHRRRRRIELKDDVRRATQKKPSLGEKDREAEPEKNIHSREDHVNLETTTPKYLAALAAEQSGTDSRTSSTRPTTPTAYNNGRSTAAPFQEQSLNLPAQMRLSSSSSSIARRSGAAAFPKYDEALIREQLSRNYSFLGEESMSKVRDAFIIVVGAGGVGSWCALMLLRSGVGRLRLIDFDQVSLSSLNRHACANLADVGRPKVVACKEHFAEIAPWTEVDAQVEIFRGNDASRLLGPWKEEGDQPVYVVDAIDNLDTKIDLLEYCYKNKIKCFSSMGAGAKSDPSQVQIADLNMTAEDPLARRVRRGLRAKGVWGAGALHRKKHNKTQATGIPEGEKEQGDKERGEDEVVVIERQDATVASPMSKKKRFQSSGRVAEDEKREVPPAQPVDKKENEAGLSRYTTSRRASSVSSMGSAQFFSPASTPGVENESLALDADEAVGEATQGFSLPDAMPTNTQAGDDKVEANNVPVRPSLSTLTVKETDASGKADRSRRTSSLKELAAEDTRSSQSGKLATRARSGLPSTVIDVDEEAVTEEGGEWVGKQGSTDEPYTIMCVYSNEKSDTRLLPLDEDEFQKGKVEELAALEDFRVRILPVLGPLPAIFGLAAATYILCDISGQKLETIPWKNRRKTYERIWTDLEATERRYPVPGSHHGKEDVATGPRRIPWSIEDIGYLYEEVFRAKSIVPPHETLSVARIMRWDSTLPLSYSNVAIFTRAEGIRHEREVLKQGFSPVEVWGEEAHKMFNVRMAEERRMNIWR